MTKKTKDKKLKIKKKREDKRGKGGITKQITFVGKTATWICPRCGTENNINIYSPNCRECGKRCPLKCFQFM